MLLFPHISSNLMFHSCGKKILNHPHFLRSVLLNDKLVPLQFNFFIYLLVPRQSVFVTLMRVRFCRSIRSLKMFNLHKALRFLLRVSHHFCCLKQLISSLMLSIVTADDLPCPVPNSSLFVKRSLNFSIRHFHPQAIQFPEMKHLLTSLHKHWFSSPCQRVPQNVFHFVSEDFKCLVTLKEFTLVFLGE